MRFSIIFLFSHLSRCFSDPSAIIPNIEQFHKAGKLDIRSRFKTFLQSKFPYDLGQFREHYDTDFDEKSLKNFELNDSLNYFKESDKPFQLWADVTHNSHSPFVNMDGYSAFLQSNPTHRRVEYAGDEICGNDYQELHGRRFSQIYAFPGLPYEIIPCLTCLKNLTGNLAVIYFNWKRNSLDGTLLNHEEDELHSEGFQSAFSSLLSLNSEIYKSELQSSYHTLLQQIGYSYVNFSPLLQHRGGRLQVSTLHFLTKEFLKSRAGKRKIWKLLNGGMSHHCLVDLDGSYLDSGVVVRVDRFHNRNLQRMKYEQFETWDSSYKPFEDFSKNIKIDVSWENFGCCSACCCSHELCGLYASMTNCKSVFSKKVRKGYLSIKKIDSQRKVSPEQLNLYFSFSPYMDKGIPLYSTVLDSHPSLTPIFQNWKTSFNTLNKITSYKGVGLYIEEKSCATDIQKLDCSELAKCKGISLKTDERESDVQNDNDVDPCSDLNITSIIVKESQSLFRVQQGQNYRIQLDSQVFNTDGGVKWKVSLEVVPSYRHKQDCSEQDRSVHANGKDLLILGLSRRDMNKRITATTLEGTRAQFELKNEQDQTNDGWRTLTVVMWTATIFIFFTLIMMFVLITESIKTKRIQRILKQRDKE